MKIRTLNYERMSVNDTLFKLFDMQTSENVSYTYIH